MWDTAPVRTQTSRSTQRRLRDLRGEYKGIQACAPLTGNRPLPFQPASCPDRPAPPAGAFATRQEQGDELRLAQLAHTLEHRSDRSRGGGSRMRSRSCRGSCWGCSTNCCRRHSSIGGRRPSRGDCFARTMRGLPRSWSRSPSKCANCKHRGSSQAPCWPDYAPWHKQPSTSISRRRWRCAIARCIATSLGWNDPKPWAWGLCSASSGGFSGMRPPRHGLPPARSHEWVLDRCSSATLTPSGERWTLFRPRRRWRVTSGAAAGLAAPLAGGIDPAEDCVSPLPSRFWVASLHYSPAHPRHDPIATSGHIFGIRLRGVRWQAPRGSPLHDNQRGALSLH